MEAESQSGELLRTRTELRVACSQIDGYRLDAAAADENFLTREVARLNAAANLLKERAGGKPEELRTAFNQAPDRRQKEAASPVTALAAATRGLEQAKRQLEELRRSAGKPR